jgi:hypothetical protein
MYFTAVIIGAFTGIYLATGRPGLPGTAMQGAAWIVCTGAAVIAARNRQIAVHRQWMARSYAVTFTFVSTRVLNLVPAYWSHLGDVLSAVGVIAFTLASIVLVDLGLNWNELTTRRQTDGSALSYRSKLAPPRSDTTDPNMESSDGTSVNQEQCLAK